MKTGQCNIGYNGYKPTLTTNGKCSHQGQGRTKVTKMSSAIARAMGFHMESDLKAGVAKIFCKGGENACGKSDTCLLSAARTSEKDTWVPARASTEGKF